MEGRHRDELFQPMEALLKDWLAAARLAEIVRTVQLAGAELTRRGIAFAWSLSQTADTQTEGPCRAGEHRAGA